ncbi:DUF4625 domain-containing protein [Rufibacter ruber]|uniref:DUF4625 domain-containing protein n=1 Tax=Rufibacter ruber TaxID=1783499 RepID=UPI000831ED2D|nr:DUF4625 domain-containing protein [Rufibacter ruber]
MKNFAFLLLSIVLFSSCGDEAPEQEKPDTEKPVITLIQSAPQYGKGTVCGHTEDRVFSVTTGGKLTLHFNFTDDVALSQYKIDVHNNFDCHGHRSGLRRGTPWFVVRIKEATGKDYKVVEELEVPADATPGNYHLLLYATDKAGTEAVPQVYSVHVSNPTDTTPPQLTMTSPTAETVTVKRGSTVPFSGTVTDAVSLNEGRVEISYSDPANQPFTVDQQFFPATAGTQATFSIPFTFATYMPTGEYKFTVEVFDTKNNKVTKKLKVVVKP